LSEVTFDVDYANWEEPAFINKGSLRAAVDIDGAVGSEAVEEPEVAIADRWVGGDESRMQGRLDGSCS
jgi:hypothetical protein